MQGVHNTKDMCRERRISDQISYDWKRKYDSMKAPNFRCLKDLYVENWKLKQVYVDFSPYNQVLKDIIKI